MSKSLLIIGSGGHAGVLVDILRQQNREILGVVSPEKPHDSKVFEDVPHYNCDEDVLRFDKREVHLVNGIGSLPMQNLRTKIYKHFTALGYKFETVIDSTAIISVFAELKEGSQVMAGAIIQTGSIIGANSIVNTGAIIEHNCKIGMYNHIAPGATISGQVISQSNVHFGTGSAVIQSIKVHKNVVIGAGVTITKDIENNTICYPARIFKKVIN